MNFLYIEYLIPVVLFILLYAYFISREENNFFKWVKQFWFYRRSRSSAIGSFLYLCALSLFALALLDLRGAEKNIDGKVLKQETLILIDSSASMLSEDVRPNRFRKAVVLAKHYVKKAVGQYIGITVFSDTQKKVVPFTSDKDLLEARLDALGEQDLRRGGTGLKLALQEAVQNFKTKAGEVSGNILVFTDAENNSDYGVIKVPDNINVAMVGIGTLQGGTIPERDGRGNFRGNKKYKGEEVISKLDQAFLQSLGDKIENYRFWMVSSYSLPTEEIINFFSTQNQQKAKKQNVRIRPVLLNYLMIPAMVLFILALLLKNFKTFVVPLLLLVALDARAQVKPKQKPPKGPEIIALQKKLAAGTISDLERRKLANELLKEGHYKDAARLSKENVKGELSVENASDYFNIATAQVQGDQKEEGIENYQKLYEFLKEKAPNSDLMKNTRLNMLKALKQQNEEQKKKKKEKEQEQKKKDKKDQGEGKKKQDKKDSSSDKQSKDGKKQTPSKDEDSKKDEKKEDGKNSKDEQKADPKDPLEDKKDQSAKRGDKMKKLPAILKQLINEDNQLQKKALDAGTQSRGDGNKKDW